MLAVVPEPENALVSTGEAGKKKHAWRRRAAVGRFQLRQSRTASPSRPSPPHATCDGRRGVARLATSVQQAVRHDRTALDSAGEAAPCAPSPSALFRAASQPDAWCPAAEVCLIALGTAQLPPTNRIIHKWNLQRN